MHDKKENQITLLMIGFVCVFIVLLCQVLLMGEKDHISEAEWTNGGNRADLFFIPPHAGEYEDVPPLADSDTTTVHR